MGSSAGTAVSLLIAGIADYSPNNLGALTLTAVVLYMIFFALGIGAVGWVVMSEVIPNNAKGIAFSIAAVGNCAGAFVVTKTFLSLEQSLGTYGFYWFYSGWCLLALIFVFFLIPETKGLPLEKSPNYSKRK